MLILLSHLISDGLHPVFCDDCMHFSLDSVNSKFGSVVIIYITCIGCLWCVRLVMGQGKAWMVLTSSFS